MAAARSSELETAENGLLNGRVRICQPREGYRARLALSPEVSRDLGHGNRAKVDRAQDLPLGAGHTEVANEFVAGLDQFAVQTEGREDHPAERSPSLRVPFSRFESNH